MKRLSVILIAGFTLAGCYAEHPSIRHDSAAYADSLGWALPDSTAHRLIMQEIAALAEEEHERDLRARKVVIWMFILTTLLEITILQ